MTDGTSRPRRTSFRGESVLAGEGRGARAVFSYEGVAYFVGNGGVSERPLPLAGCASLRAADGRACVGSLRERSAPFEVPPDAG